MTVPVKDGPMTEATERDALTMLLVRTLRPMGGYFDDKNEARKVADAILSAGYARRTEATGEARSTAHLVARAHCFWRTGWADTLHSTLCNEIATALTEFVRTAEERERERCAKIAESYVLRIGHPEVDKFARNVAENIARIIRTPRTEEGR